MRGISEVDIIVVGGGAAGSVVAARLAQADPTLQVALVEAGKPSTYTPFIKIFIRSVEVHVGAVLGGGSSINFLKYTRPSASDFDDWKTEGWAFKDLLPLARKLEKVTFQAISIRRCTGLTDPLNSELGKQYVPSALANSDVPFADDTQDFTSLAGHCVGPWPNWISPTTGRRQDAAHGYVNPGLSSQPAVNLHLLTECEVETIIFEGSTNRAVGVKYTNAAGQQHTLRARKLVVLSSGALASPGILERSGGGAKEVLDKAGIKLLVEVGGP